MINFLPTIILVFYVEILKIMKYKMTVIFINNRNNYFEVNMSTCGLGHNSSVVEKNFINDRGHKCIYIIFVFINANNSNHLFIIT